MENLPNNQFKICNKCGVNKSFDCYHKNKNYKYGISSICKDCKRIEAKEYREKNNTYNKEYYKKNKEKILESQKKYYFENKERIHEINKKWALENKEKTKQIKQKWSDNNKEKIMQTAKKYRESNREKIKRAQKKFRENNLEKVKKWIREYSKTENGRLASLNSIHKRRTVIKYGDVTTNQLLELQNNSKTCYWCNTSLKNKKSHIDHYIPISKGGKHTISNLVISCSKCNLTKGTKDPLEFALSIGKLF